MDRPEPRLVYFIYSLLMGLAALLLVPYWLVQGLRHGKYIYNLGERPGFSFPALDKMPWHSTGATLIHSVRVGEGLSLSSIAARMREGYTQLPLLIPTTHNTTQP